MNHGRSRIINYLYLRPSFYPWMILRQTNVKQRSRRWRWHVANYLLANSRYTVKVTRAKLPANAGNFTGGMHVKRPHTQFTCATCSLLVNTGKLTRVCAASTSRRLHANCLQAHVNLPEHNGYFTSNFTCGTHAHN